MLILSVFFLPFRTNDPYERALKDYTRRGHIPDTQVEFHRRACVSISIFFFYPFRTNDPYERVLKEYTRSWHIPDAQVESTDVYISIYRDFAFPPLVSTNDPYERVLKEYTRRGHIPDTPVEFHLSY